MCVVLGCRRSVKQGSRFCGSCWSFVPVETKLAMEGHHEALQRPWYWIGYDYAGEDRDRWLAFITFSYTALLSLAAAESYEVRTTRALEDLKARTRSEND